MKTKDLTTTLIHTILNGKDGNESRQEKTITMNIKDSTLYTIAAKSPAKGYSQVKFHS